uniref:Uncharacterized protein n=1 Tax=Anguilla anguilla TaxID=7936 RepID=A0A0E9XER4_ANGAN
MTAVLCSITVTGNDVMVSFVHHFFFTFVVSNNVYLWFGLVYYDQSCLNETNK